MRKNLLIALVAGLIAWPAGIQADGILLASSTNASSTAVAASMTIPVARTTPAFASPFVVDSASDALALSGTVSSTKVVSITAYASVPDETSDHPFITASGATVADGIVAANWLPFGTKIEIPSLFGNKVFTVEDRMNSRFSSRLDIWMPTVSQAVDFGLRQAEVVILSSTVSPLALQ